GSQTRRCYDPCRLVGQDDATPVPALYLDIGTEDYDRMRAMNHRVRDALLARGHPVEYHERPGSHDWQSSSTTRCPRRWTSSNAVCRTLRKGAPLCMGASESRQPSLLVDRPAPGVVAATLNRPARRNALDE